MRGTYEITKTLVLSTAHVTRDAADWLTNQTRADVAQFVAQLVVYEKGDYGWWANVASDDVLSRSMPECVRDCCRLAKQLECDWLMFDCDGNEYPELPTYEWENEATK